MREKQNKILLIIEFLRFFMIIFNIMIISTVLAGLIIPRYIPEANVMSTLFVLKGTGLPYNSIFQIAALSFILAIYNVLLYSEYFLIKMRFLLRFFLFSLMTFFTNSIFGIIFKWFPANESSAWISYTLSSIICFVIVSGIIFIRFKFENKKYNMLLTNFKTKKKKDNILS
jgi:hypothetical protein